MNCFKITLIFVFVVFSGLVAYPQSNVPDAYYGCGDEAIGYYRAHTGAIWKSSGSDSDGLRLGNDADIKNNIWALSDAEKADPAYMFALARPSDGKRLSTCPKQVKVDGELISPFGIIYKYRQAIVDTQMLTLAVTTVERDGVVYEGAVQFLNTPKEMNGWFLHGHAKLKASGKKLGVLELEFDFSENSCC